MVLLESAYILFNTRKVFYLAEGQSTALSLETADANYFA